MSKKTPRWESEDVSLNNPFATLKPASSSEGEAKKPVEAMKAMVDPKMPKAKSARVERAHRGGKTVTLVYFYGEPSDEAKTMWLKNTKSALGIGGQLEEDHVYLQGEQVDRLKSSGFLK